MQKDKSPNIGKFNFIDNWYSKLFSSTTLFILIGIGAIFFIITNWHRYVYIDDAFFGEQSYWLAKDGVVKTPSLIDFLGCDVQLFSYHKLNIFIGALLIKIFGWKITPLHLATLFFFACLVYFIIKWYKSEKNIYTRNHLIIILFFLIFTPQVYYLLFTFRPELWVTFFGFASYYYITRLVKENHNKYAILSGVFAGLAFLTHLNGLIFPVAGFVVLLFHRKYKPLLIYSGITFAISTLYFWDLWQGNNFSAWLYQLKNWPDNNTPNYFKGDVFSFIKGVVLKLSEEHKRFFWGYKVWAISSFFLLSFIFNFKYFYKNQKLLFIYIITLIVVQNVAGSQIAERYLLYYYPFMAIIISYELVKLFKEHAPVRKSIYIILLVLQVYCVGKLFQYMIKENKYSITYYDATLERIPDKQNRILVPYEMFFHGLDTYNLVSYKGFEYYQSKINKQLTQDELFRRAQSLGIKYIVIPERVIDNVDGSLPCLMGGNIKPNIYYREFYKDNKTIILERQ